MKNILLATTGTSQCRKAEDYALEYCLHHGATLRIIHVVEPQLDHYGLVDSLATETDRHDFIDHTRKLEMPSIQERLERILNQAKALGIKYELYIQWDAPLYSIVKQARKENVELLVIGGREKRFNPFSLAMSLTRKAPCQVKQVY
ncbi:MAG: universal stress protein [Desulfovibrionaceae bacterium]|jgi:nucleotide-binding universal stress UspA family protein